MNEYAAAMMRFADQLTDAGIPLRERGGALGAYCSALHERTETAWRTFYLTVYAALERLAERDRSPGGDAAMPLLRLISDDFGSRLVDRPTFERIRWRLVEYALREASLSS